MAGRPPFNRPSDRASSASIVVGSLLQQPPVDRSATNVATWDPGSFTADLIAEMRAHGGVPSQGPFAGRRLLILTTTGARSGKPRIAVLAYRLEGEQMVVAGSKGGAPTHPGWFYNLQANPVATVEVNNEVMQVTARIEAEGTERDRLWAQHVAEMPGFGDYPAKTDRIIPMVIVSRLS
jgi:deazaflavin-dependent oxidoreductase (nitroreductase family)